MSQCHFEQQPYEGREFSRSIVTVQKRRIFALQNLALQGFAAIGMRRAASWIVPGRIAAIAKGGLGFVPGPQLHQGVHPKVQMTSPEVRPEVAKLLLAGSPDLLDVVENLFDGRPIGERFQDFCTLACGSVEKKNSQPSDSWTITTRIMPHAGR